MSKLAEIQEVIKELRPDERTAIREWLNGYDGNALIFLNPLDSSCWVGQSGEKKRRRDGGSKRDRT